jgi:ABC-type sugar transport system ATPase subunit
MRTWIRRLHKLLKKTTVYVTHDQAEAMALGSQIALLNEGKIEQFGSPDELYYNPINKFTAQFIGNFPMNFIPFQFKDNNLLYKNGNEIEAPANIKNIIKSKKIKSGDIGFRAEYIREYDPTKPVDKEMILIDCEIEDIEKVLDQQILTLKHEEIQLFFVTKTKKEFKKNDILSIVVHSDHIYVFDNGGKRLEK